MYDKESLFAFARAGIEEKWNLALTKEPKISSELEQKRAAFVTISLNNQLRGCVGSLIAHQPLWQEVKENGYNAAFNDYRFSELTIEEYQKIVLEISILTPPETVVFTSKEHLKELVRPNIDGIIYLDKGQQATFLPQVWEQLPDFDLFFSHLAQKAGLGKTPDFKSCSIMRYQVEAFHE